MVAAVDLPSPGKRPAAAPCSCRPFLPSDRSPSPPREGIIRTEVAAVVGGAQVVLRVGVAAFGRFEQRPEFGRPLRPCRRVIVGRLAAALAAAEPRFVGREAGPTALPGGGLEAVETAHHDLVVATRPALRDGGVDALDALDLDAAHGDDHVPPPDPAPEGLPAPLDVGHTQAVVLQHQAHRLGEVVYKRTNLGGRGGEKEEEEEGEDGDEEEGARVEAAADGMSGTRNGGYISLVSQYQ